MPLLQERTFKYLTGITACLKMTQSGRAGTKTRRSHHESTKERNHEKGLNEKPEFWFSFVSSCLRAFVMSFARKCRNLRCKVLRPETRNSKLETRSHPFHLSPECLLFAITTAAWRRRQSTKCCESPIGVCPRSARSQLITVVACMIIRGDAGCCD
jgi:hypothetical protein